MSIQNISAILDSSGTPNGSDFTVPEIPTGEGQNQSFPGSMSMENCNDTETLIRTPWFWTSLSFHLFFAPPAILFNLILFILLIRKSLLHSNLRLILTNLSFWCLFGSSYLLAKGLFTWFAALDIGVYGTCSLVLTKLFCKFQEIPFLVAEFMVVGSLLAIAVERCSALPRLNNEREEKENACMGQFLTMALWTLSLSGLVVALFVVGKGDLPYCNSLFTFDETEWGPRILELILLGLEILGLFFFLLVWTINRIKSRKQHQRTSYSLTWQICRKRNIAMTEMLLPCVLAHAIFWIFILGLALLQLEILPLFPDDIHILVHLVISEFLLHDLAALYMLLHPVLLLWYSEALRRESRECCPCLRAIVPVEIRSSGSHNEIYGGDPTYGMSMTGHGVDNSVDALGYSIWQKPRGKDFTVHDGSRSRGAGDMEDMHAGLLPERGEEEERPPPRQIISTTYHVEDVSRSQSSYQGDLDEVVRDCREEMVNIRTGARDVDNMDLDPYQDYHLEGAPLVKEESGFAYIEDRC